MYDTREEAQQKLANCIVLFQDKPTLIIEASGTRNKVLLQHQLLRTKETRVDNITSKDFGFRDFGDRLGYTNCSISNYKESLYVTRMPIRKSYSTQGLSQANVRIPALKGSYKFGLPKANINWSQMYNQSWFLDTLEKMYPTLAQVAMDLSKDAYLTSKAFSRQLAVRRDPVGPFYLEYRGRDIGYTEDFDKWKIGENFKYLFETLEMYELKVS